MNFICTKPSFGTPVAYFVRGHLCREILSTPVTEVTTESRDGLYSDITTSEFEIGTEGRVDDPSLVGKASRSACMRSHRRNRKTPLEENSRGLMSRLKCLLNRRSREF